MTLADLICWLRGHDYTSLAAQEIPPDQSRIQNDPINYFKEYASMYCHRCKRVFDL